MTYNPAHVVRVGRHRLRIIDADGSSQLERVHAWITGRPEVLRVLTRDRSLEITLTGPNRAFARAIEDFVFTLGHPPPPAFDVEIAHATIGRLRLRIGGVADDDLVRVSQFAATLPGVTRAAPSPVAATVLIVFDEARICAAEIRNAIAGIDRSTWPTLPKTPSAKSLWRLTAFNSAVLGLSAAAVLPEALTAAAVALTALPTVRRTLKALRSGDVTVDALDTAAVAASIATGQPTTGAFITWLLGLGDVLLEHISDRAHKAVSELMHLESNEAWRIKDGEVTQVEPHLLEIGDTIVVAAGQRVPADGVVMSGIAMVDEKALTGESMPRTRQSGDPVLAATVVIEGQLIARVERKGGDTTAAKIVKILEGYGAKPMTLQSSAEAVANRLVLPTFGLAGALALLGLPGRMTSVFITDFGTGVRIAVPMNALAAMTAAAKRGLLFKGGQYLERLSKADVIIFDKTGTLTTGQPEIVDTIAFAKRPVTELIALVAGLEQRQSHPIALAFARYAEQQGIAPRPAELGSEEHAVGLGLRARIGGESVVLGGVRWLEQNGCVIDTAARATLQKHVDMRASSLLIGIDGDVVGAFAYSDRPRPESAAVVQTLKARGRRRIVLLSGDGRAPVQAIAQELGIDEAHGDLLPQDKALFVQQLQRAGHVVAMVGDGINDAPALALADVGISIHDGTEVALETADVVLLEGGLEKLVLAFASADKAMQRVRRSLGLVIAPNAVGMGLAALGLINPMAASVLNNGSTVFAALVALSPILKKSDA